MPILALLLLAAAGAKMLGRAVEPISSSGLLADPSIQMGVVIWESALSLWILSRQAPFGAWLATTASFSAFACAASWQLYQGQSSCGYAGALVKIHPSVALIVDVAALTILAMTRRRAMAADARAAFAAAFRPLVMAAAGMMMMLGVFTAIGTLAFDSPAAALAYLRGERISVSPRLVDVGLGEPGEWRETTVELSNRTDHPIRLIGGTHD